MTKSIIKKDATYKFNKETNTVILEGTNIEQLGDILADAILLLPKFTSFGVVSRGAYIQALKVYEEVIDLINIQSPLIINGHSLGAGIGQILALLIDKHFFHCGIILNCKGSIKVLGYKARKELSNIRLLTIEDYAVRYRDPVPTLGWWLEPIHNTGRTGDKKSWLLDYDMNEHIAYWD